MSFTKHVDSINTERIFNVKAGEFGIELRFAAYLVTWPSDFHFY
jgi:hypothetical protein